MHCADLIAEIDLIEEYVLIFLICSTPRLCLIECRFFVPNVVLVHKHLIKHFLQYIPLLSWYCCWCHQRIFNQ